MVLNGNRSSASWARWIFCIVDRKLIDTSLVLSNSMGKRGWNFPQSKNSLSVFSLQVISVVWFFPFFFIERKLKKEELNELKTKLLFQAEQNIVFDPSWFCRGSFLCFVLFAFSLYSAQHYMQGCCEVGAQHCPHGTSEEADARMKWVAKTSPGVSTTARNRVWVPDYRSPA